MIFVAVGTQKFPFDRLIKMVDDIAARQGIEFFAQIGTAEYEPKNMQFERYLNRTEFEQKIEECDLLITHSGVATIMAGLKRSKPVIVVPRLSKYGEHIDDHQLQVAETYSFNNYILQYEDGQDLSKLVEKAQSFEFKEYVSSRENVLHVIKEFIAQEIDETKKK